MDAGEKKEIAEIIADAVKSDRSNRFVDFNTCRDTRKEVSGAIKTITTKIEAVHEDVIHTRDEQKKLSSDLEVHVRENGVRREYETKVNADNKDAEKMRLAKVGVIGRWVALGLALAATLVSVSMFLAKAATPTIDSEEVAKIVSRMSVSNNVEE